MCVFNFPTTQVVAVYICLSHVPAGHLRDDGEPGAFWAFLNSQSTQAATQLG